MADESGSAFIFSPTFASGKSGFVVKGNAFDLGGGSGPVPKYKMRARESVVSAPGYVTWTATGTPDFAGSGFSGGEPTPSNPMILGSAVIADEWEE